MVLGPNGISYTHKYEAEGEFMECMLCGYVGYIYLRKKEGNKMEDARDSKTPSI